MKQFKRLLSISLVGLLVMLYLVPTVVAAGKVNINTAEKKQLITLKHVGDKISDRIIEYRKAQPFEVPEDIMKVKGIGQKVFDVNKERIIVKNE
ncbi:MAG: helix-hairpin-helix domain-containing protein [Desulfobacula sp.]|jgi:competence protein ComEA|nr:helix-hairpin-helix domain-containing protein [Desulfobacula sp.]